MSLCRLAPHVKEYLSRTVPYSSQQQRVTIHLSISLNGRRLKIQLLSDASHMSVLRSPAEPEMEHFYGAGSSLGQCRPAGYIPGGEFCSQSSAGLTWRQILRNLPPKSLSLFLFPAIRAQRGTALFFPKDCMQCGGGSNVPCVLLARTFCFCSWRPVEPCCPQLPVGTPVTGSLPAEAWLPAPLLRATSLQIQVTSLSSLRPGRLHTLNLGPPRLRGQCWCPGTFPLAMAQSLLEDSASFLTSLPATLLLAGGDLRVAKCRWPCPVLILLELLATACTLSLGFQSATASLITPSPPRLQSRPPSAFITQPLVFLLL